MPQGQVLEFSGATKRFGGVTAVSDFTARVEPGMVTGFLGPNGAGKTTSLRMLLGLVKPTSGTATIDGVHYAKLKNPLQTVGAVLEASSFHPGRTGAAHLTVYAHAARIPKARVEEVLGLVGLSDAAGRKVGGYSLGMRQRLGLAYALLGDPGVLVLDEPTNGLDPEGIIWIRGFLRQLAREGRTVFVSSHLLTEVQQTVDALLIISRGRLVFQGALEELSDPAEQATVVDSADRAALAAALTAAGIPFEVLRSGLTVRGIEPVSVGLAAAAAGVPLSSLHKRGPALEEVFLDLVNGVRVHASAAGAGRDDVIPAIESGQIVVAETEEQAPDAASEESADATAEAPEAAEEVVEDDIAPEVDLAPEPEAEAEPKPEVEAEPEPEAEAEAEAEPEIEPELEVEPEPEVEAEPEAEVEPEIEAPHEPETRTASFAVASTGVIDVIPLGDDERAADAPEQPTPQDADEGTPDEGTPDEGTPDEPADEDRPWEDYVKTDSDVEADRFFAAFDASAGAAGPADGAEHAGDEASDLPAGEGDAPEPPGEHEQEREHEPAHHEHAHDDREGGEHR
jgi:ABC-2 type transport system ATP-binding protein